MMILNQGIKDFLDEISDVLAKSGPPNEAEVAGREQNSRQSAAHCEPLTAVLARQRLFARIDRMFAGSGAEPNLKAIY